jgi:hypothetical protein
MLNTVIIVGREKVRTANRIIHWIMSFDCGSHGSDHHLHYLLSINGYKSLSRRYFPVGPQLNRVTTTLLPTSVSSNAFTIWGRTLGWKKTMSPGKRGMARPSVLRRGLHTHLGAGGIFGQNFMHASNTHF